MMGEMAPQRNLCDFISDFQHKIGGGEGPLRSLTHKASLHFIVEDTKEEGADEGHPPIHSLELGSGYV